MGKCYGLLHCRFTSRSLSTTATGVEYFHGLCEAGRIKEAFNSFSSRIWKDPSLFSHLLKACIVPTNSLCLAQQLHSLIVTSGCSSTRFVSNHLLDAYAKLGQSDAAVKMFDRMPKRNTMSCNILINGFVQVGDLDSAMNLFDEMSQPKSVATWNAVLAGLTQFERNEEAMCLLFEMHGSGFMPDEFTLGSVLRGCAGLKNLYGGRQLHAYAIKSQLECKQVIGSSLAHMYFKSGSFGEGEKVIKAMPVLNVVACNTVIAGRAQSRCFEEALSQYHSMKMVGFRPDRITFVTVLHSCSELATLGQGQQIHAEAVKAGASLSPSVISSLVSMYSRCGCLEDSVKAFSESEVADVVVWSAAISAYGFHGRGKDAIELFEQMELSGLEATDVTFLSLLYACSHSGLKDKGIELFDLMKEKYGLEPQVQHYTCIVDLLGRSGRLHEAEDFIRSMPVKADAIIWKTLLSACKIHKNANVAKRVVEEVLGLDPLDSASYVLLSNIQASTKSWEDVSDVRKAMRDRRVKKEPGISWFEVKNQVHQFCTSNDTHPRAREIDNYLKELISEMKLLGYVPDTGSIFRDLDLEDKEYELAHHSEKLAIAFALMTMPEGVPIRVMKNLRICSDCHVAIKYISAIKNREIIVRDASRFHHFKDGQCSCGNYW